jgi:hypothetical protein
MSEHEQDLFNLDNLLQNAENDEDEDEVDGPDIDQELADQAKEIEENPLLKSVFADIQSLGAQEHLQELTPEQQKAYYEINKRNLIDSKEK